MNYFKNAAHFVRNLAFHDNNKITDQSTEGKKVLVVLSTPVIIYINALLYLLTYIIDCMIHKLTWHNVLPIRAIIGFRLIPLVTLRL